MTQISMVMEEVKSYPIPEFEIRVKHKGLPMSKRTKVSGSKDCYEVMMRIFDADSIDWVESFMLVCLNRANKVLGFYKVSQGGVSGTVADPKVIFVQALLTPGTCTIIVAHNHPSGNLTASQSDIELTRKLKEAGKVLEIQVLDHLIVTSEGYYSFADEGLMS